MSNHTFKIATKAAIIDEQNCVLLLRRHADDEFGGLWDIPGGRIEWGEKPLEGLAREVSEETGLSVTSSQPFNVWTFMSGQETQVVGITFKVCVAAGKINLSKEHTEYTWSSLKDLSEHNMHPSLKDELGSLLKSLNG